MTLYIIMVNFLLGSDLDGEIYKKKLYYMNYKPISKIKIVNTKYFGSKNSQPIA